jgi:hypothetical protein
MDMKDGGDLDEHTVVAPYMGDDDDEGGFETIVDRGQWRVLKVWFFSFMLLVSSLML